jgi:3-oxoacyl-[acyl-carrier protein] reductase
MTPTAFVTGASRGIGRGIALCLAGHGFDIIAGATQADPANTEKGLYEVQQRIEERGRRCFLVTGDIGQIDAHEQMVQDALDQAGRIDVLVNNAGVAPDVRLDVLETTPASYDRVMGINLRGPLFLTQRVAHQMVRQVREEAAFAPVIIFVTSISATAASPNRIEYCVSKAGLSMVAQTFAVRLAEYGINVYEVRPGVVATDMTAAVQEKYDTLIEQGLLLQRRWGTPEDVGKAVAAFATGQFAYATGAAIEVGGGFSVSRL